MGHQKLSIVVCFAALLISCNNNPTNPDPWDGPESVSVNITVITQDIFTDADIGGEVVINGQKKASGSIFSVQNGRLNSVYVEVPNYYGAYIVGRDATGEVVFTRDADGFSPVSALGTVYVKLIPKDFDTVLLAKTFGDGSVRNYNKQTINVGIMKDTEPDGVEPTIDNIKDLKEAIDIINNAAKRVISLNYIGKIADEMDDGVTNKIRRNVSLHKQYYNGHIVTSSYLATDPKTSLSTLLEELTQASTGLVGDVHGIGFAYIVYTGWKNDGERAIQLANLLPPGFKLDTEGSKCGHPIS